MSTKAATKTTKSRASNSGRSKSSRQAEKTTKATSSRTQHNARKGHLARSAVTGKFVAAKTGRVIKSSPAKPRLGKQRIHTIVRNWLSRDIIIPG